MFKHSSKRKTAPLQLLFNYFDVFLNIWGKISFKNLNKTYIFDYVVNTTNHSQSTTTCSFIDCINAIIEGLKWFVE